MQGVPLNKACKAYSKDPRAALQTLIDQGCPEVYDLERAYRSWMRYVEGEAAPAGAEGSRAHLGRGAGVRDRRGHAPGDDRVRARAEPRELAALHRRRRQPFAPRAKGPRGSRAVRRARTRRVPPRKPGASRATATRRWPWPKANTSRCWTTTTSSCHSPFPRRPARSPGTTPTCCIRTRTSSRPTGRGGSCAPLQTGLGRRASALVQLWSRTSSWPGARWWRRSAVSARVSTGARTTT